MAEAAWKSKVAHATTLGGSYTNIEGIKSVSFPLTRDELDTTDMKDDAGWRTFIMGLASGEITMSGDETEGDTQIEALQDSLINGTSVFLQFVNDAGIGFKGEFFVTSYEKGAEVGSLASVSIRARLTGAPTEV